MRLPLIVVLFLCLVLPGWADPVDPGLLYHPLLIHAPTASGGRTALHSDPIEYDIVQGRWTPPVAGIDGWETIAPDDSGLYEHEWLAGGYAYWRVESPIAQVLLLEALGDAAVYVNGEIRMGDVYSTGYVVLPVQLHAGSNDFLFLAGRGELKPKLRHPETPLLINDLDLTTPSVIPSSELERRWLGVPVINASTTPVLESDGWELLILGDIPTRVLGQVPVVLPPLSCRKIPVSYAAIDSIATSQAIPTELAIGRPRTKSSDPANWEIMTRLPLVLDQPDPGQAYKRTFISDIDGSVQYYAIRPKVPADSKQGDALILSLHGAAVEALGQARAYGPHDWATVVCPTNRRPFGFDWEDWGRLDALEVLKQAHKDFQPEGPTYLTGHSMGGHGTWYLAATTQPDLYGRNYFSAIGPSAGWESFFTYAGKPRATPNNPILEAIERASNQSDTSLVLNNLMQYPTYVLHGIDDDNVPIAEARSMVEQLTAAGKKNLVFHEQPDAGHWWDVDPKPGADCVDWTPMWDYMRNQLSARDPLATDITVVNPSLGASGHIVIQQQIVPLMPSRVTGRWSSGEVAWTGTTDNVAALNIELSASDQDQIVEIDGTRFNLGRQMGRHWVRLTGPHPGLVTTLTLPSKMISQNGPFKQAFDQRFVLVYGTQGDDATDALTYARARFDAEQWWIRGNGTTELIADVDFDDELMFDRNVILYGNADTNSRWELFLSRCPIQVRDGRVTVGNYSMLSDEVGGLFIFPRYNSGSHLVGVVTGTGPVGLRLTERMRYFSAGVHYPDYTFLTLDNLLAESEGLVAAGYYTNEWGIADE